MTSDSHDDVLQALADYARNRLMDGHSVHIPDLGTLDTEHRPSEMQKDEDGNIVMVPPKDVITFTPDA